MATAPANITISATELYRSAELATVNVGGDAQLVHPRHGGATRVMPRALVSLATQCRRFDTLDNHARAACRQLRLPPEKAGEVRGKLAELTAAGLLVSFSELRGQLAPNTSGLASCVADAPPAIATVGFVTRNRPAMVERAVASFVENSRRYGRGNDFVVMDDSDAATAREQTRHALRGLAQQHGVTVLYAGPEEKRRFADALVAAGLPKEMVEFALFGAAVGASLCGANRNALSLHTAGDMISSVDDDVLSRVALSPKFQEGLTISTQSDPAEFWFYPNRETALGGVTFVEKDPLAIHEQMLGRTLGGCAQVLGATELNLDKMSERFIASLRRGGGQVRVTMLGLLGDCAMTWPRWFLLSGPSGERLLQSEAGYRSTFVSREFLRVVAVATINAGPMCMAYALGLDNRDLLPPFFPVGRNCDGVFGQTLQRCFADSYYGHFPQSILHAPEDGRTFPAGSVEADATTRTLSELLLDCIRPCDFGPACFDDRERLRILGEHLTSMAALPPAEFQDFARTRSWQQTGQMLQAMEQRLRAAKDSPSFWATDVKQYALALRKAMTTGDFGMPTELRNGRSAAEADALTQQLVGQFGELLCWWPAMVDAARSLRVQGVRLAQPVV